MIYHTPTGPASRPILMRPASSADKGDSPDHSLIVVGSCPERMQRLRAALGDVSAKITWRATTEEIIRALDSSYEVVIVDVDPERLADMLRAVRERAAHAVILVLVECGSLNASVNLAGVLPSYRAMACSYNDLVKLVRWRFAPSVSPHQAPWRIL